MTLGAPFCKEFTSGAELLHPGIARIGNVDISIRVHRYPGRALELAVVAALVAPTHKQDTGAGELLHPVIEPVAHIDMFIPIYGYAHRRDELSITQDRSNRGF